MVNPFARVDWSPDRAAIRSFAKTVAIGMPIVALAYSTIGRVFSGEWPVRFAVTLTAAGFVLAGVSAALPPLGRWVYRVWYAVACTIGFITSNGILAAIFLGVLTPLGVARRLGGLSPFLRGPDRRASTYWTTPTGDAGYDRQH